MMVVHSSYASSAAKLAQRDDNTAPRRSCDLIRRNHGANHQQLVEAADELLARFTAAIAPGPVERSHGAFPLRLSGVLDVLLVIFELLPGDRREGLR